MLRNGKGSAHGVGSRFVLLLLASAFSRETRLFQIKMLPFPHDMVEINYLLTLYIDYSSQVTFDTTYSRLFFPSKIALTLAHTYYEDDCCIGNWPSSSSTSSSRDRSRAFLHMVPQENTRVVSAR